MKKEGSQNATKDQKRLYEAAVSGRVELLNQLIKEDGLILARFTSDETPLHIASMHGHLDLAALLIKHRPDMATEYDSRGSSPLHLASFKGYVEIVKLLVSVNNDVCLHRDHDGWIPLHLAVMKGHVDAIVELVRAKPEALHLKLNRGETVLHLCVKKNSLEALKKLVELGGVDDLINVKDSDGNAILHVATALNQMETIKYLLNRTGVEVNAVNANNLAALDIIELGTRDRKGTEILESLQNAGALRAKRISESGQFYTDQFKDEDGTHHEHGEIISGAGASDVVDALDKLTRFMENQDKQGSKEKKSDALMIAATLIATMAYSATLSPPGGVWGETETQEDGTIYWAGTSIMARNYPDHYKSFWKNNTICFVASLSIVLLLVSGLPVHKRIITWPLRGAMWVTITFMTITYTNTVDAIAPWSVRSTLTPWLERSIELWKWLVVVIFVANAIGALLWCIVMVQKLRIKRKEYIVLMNGQPLVSDFLAWYVRNKVKDLINKWPSTKSVKGKGSKVETNP